jgi:hypothetical protein
LSSSKSVNPFCTSVMKACHFGSFLSNFYTSTLRGFRSSFTNFSRGFSGTCVIVPPPCFESAKEILESNQPSPFLLGCS